MPYKRNMRFIYTWVPSRIGLNFCGRVVPCIFEISGRAVSVSDSSRSKVGTAATWVGGWIEMCRWYEESCSHASRKINTWLLYRDEKQTSFNGVVDAAISSVTNVKLKETEKRKKNRYCFRYVPTVIIIIIIPCTSKYLYFTIVTLDMCQLNYYYYYYYYYDRLCGLVVRVPGYRSRSPGFDSRRYQIFWEVVGLERGPLSLVRII
jgi:hypothetical protein